MEGVAEFFNSSYDTVYIAQNFGGKNMGGKNMGGFGGWNSIRRFLPPIILTNKLFNYLRARVKTVTRDPDKMSILKHFKLVDKKEKDFAYQIQMVRLANECHHRLLKQTIRKSPS